MSDWESTMKCCLTLCVALLAGPVNAARIKVVDETGAGVEHYEIMWHTADSGYCRWQAGDGLFSDGRHSTCPWHEASLAGHA